MKIRGEKKSKESGQKTQQGSPPSHGCVSLEYCKRGQRQSQGDPSGALHEYPREGMKIYEKKIQNL